MSLTDRFRHLDLGVIEYRALAYMREQWKRRARQAAVEQSGACVSPHVCGCPNCVEYEHVMERAMRYQRYGVGSGDAFKRACLELTGGIVPTPWSDVAGTYGDR